MNAVVTGATGLIGSRLCPELLGAGYTVSALTRNPAKAAALLPSGVNTFEDGVTLDDAMAEADVVFNFAGEPIGARWTAELKEKIRRSRIDTTRRVVVSLRSTAKSGKQRTLVNASAVGYYGDCHDEAVTEQHAPGTDFLATVCTEWEKEANAAREVGVQVVTLRLGIVLAKGGALNAILYPLPIHISPVKLGLGGPLGSGRQWMPWVHIDDVIGIALFSAKTPAVSGALNVTAPTPVTNREFMRTLGKVLHRPAVLPIQALSLRMMLGEFANVLLAGQMAQPAKALQAGYKFKFTELEPALRNLLG